MNIFYDPSFVFASVVGGCVFIYRLRQATSGLSLMKTGKYDEAIAFYSKLAEAAFWPGKAQTYLYNVAVCQHRKGSFAEAISTLEKINPEKLRKHHRLIYYALFARTLIMEGKDFDRADHYHELAIPDNDNIDPCIGDVFLYKCHQACVKNDLPSARSFLSRYSEICKPKENSWAEFFVNVVVKDIVMNWQYKEALEGYLLGYFHWKNGNISEAKTCLQRASQYPYRDYYSTRARELLAELPEAESQISTA